MRNGVPATGLRVTGLRADILVLGGGLGGKLAHVKIWTRPLSSDEIGDEKNDNRNVSTTGLAGWWPFDEGSGLSARDKSGNGRTGTFQVDELEISNQGISAKFKSVWNGGSSNGRKAKCRRQNQRKAHHAREGTKACHHLPLQQPQKIHQYFFRPAFS